jgi:hypothetical protein
MLIRVLHHINRSINYDASIMLYIYLVCGTARSHYTIINFSPLLCSLPFAFLVPGLIRISQAARRPLWSLRLVGLVFFLRLLGHGHMPCSVN